MLLPAPEGPIIPVNSPDLNFPFTPFRIVLYPRRLPSDTEYFRSTTKIWIISVRPTFKHIFRIPINWMSTGGRLDKCARVKFGFFEPPLLLFGTLRSVLVLPIATDEDPLQSVDCDPLKVKNNSFWILLVLSKGVTILQRNQDLKMVKIDRKSFLVIFDDYFVGTNYTSKHVISCKVTTSYANRPSRLKT